jgi:hypothetical protein
MSVSVVRSERGHRLVGEGTAVEMANQFLDHLEVRRYSPATVRAYAFDLLNFNGFLEDRNLRLVDVRAAISSAPRPVDQARRRVVGRCRRPRLRSRTGGGSRGRHARRGPHRVRVSPRERTGRGPRVAPRRRRGQRRSRCASHSCPGPRPRQRRVDHPCRPGGSSTVRTGRSSAGSWRRRVAPARSTNPSNRPARDSAVVACATRGAWHGRREGGRRARPRRGPSRERAPRRAGVPGAFAPARCELGTVTPRDHRCRGAPPRAT